MTTTRYEDIIVRNRAHRVRDLAFGLLLAAVTAFALGSLGSANAAAQAAPVAGSAPACTVTVTAC